VTRRSAKSKPWARANDFGSVLFTNLFAIRTPYQSEMIRLADGHYEQAVGPQNDNGFSELLSMVRWWPHGVSLIRLYCLGYVAVSQKLSI